MKILTAFILLVIFPGCLDLDRWDKRYKIEAEDKCHCMETWQKEMTPNLQKLYKESVDIINHSYDGRGQTFSEENMLTVAKLKAALTDEELDWNNRLGKAFFDKNSELYKCWNKRYSWSQEYPGNNTKYTTPSHAFKMHCMLTFYLLEMEESERKIVNAVFD